MTTPSDNTNSKENNQETNVAGYEADPTKKPEVENDLGNEKESESDIIKDMYKDDDEKPEDKKEDDKPKEDDDDKVKDPVTGYDNDSKEKDDKKLEDLKKPKGEDDKPKGEDDKDSEELKEENVKELLKELPETYNKDSLSKFALENKMSKAQIEAYVKFAQDENNQELVNQEAQLLETRKQWRDELFNDPTFGGENFDKNLFKVEKILENHMPNMKKTLTDRKFVLPPYIMKDLLGIDKILNPKNDLIQGDPSKVEKKESKNFLNDLYE